MTACWIRAEAPGASQETDNAREEKIMRHIEERQTYYVNDIMMGQDATTEDAQHYVDWLNEHGYDAEFTYNAGYINHAYDDSSPGAVTDETWEQYLSEVRI